MREALLLKNIPQPAVCGTWGKKSQGWDKWLELPHLKNMSSERYNQRRKDYFFSKVSKTDTCWNWTGYLRDGHYGAITIGGKKIMAHRYSYELYRGPIPKDRVIDHICRNKRCVNPEHLRIVTFRENVLENSDHISVLRSRNTHCPKGHEYTESNTVRIRGRECRTCLRERGKLYSQRFRAKKE